VADPYAGMSNHELFALADEALLKGIDAPEGSEEREALFAEHEAIAVRLKLRLEAQAAAERGQP